MSLSLMLPFLLKTHCAAFVEAVLHLMLLSAVSKTYICEYRKNNDAFKCTKT